MKSKIIIAAMIAGAMSFTSCTKKIDDKTVAEINQIGTDWTALGEKATSWSNDLTQSATQSKDFAAQQTKMMNEMASSKDEATKQKVSEMAAKANSDASRFEAMETEWNTFKSTWDETTKQYTDFKEKAMAGQVTPEQANTSIADFKTKMSDAQAKIDSWSTSYAEIKTSTEQNMASAENIKTAEPATATKK